MGKHTAEHQGLEAIEYRFEGVYGDRNIGDPVEYDHLS